MTNLGKNNPILRELNQGALLNEKVSVVNQDAFTFIENTNAYFDVLIIDLPDPKSADIGRLYTLEFYELCRRHLRPFGVLVTQAGSPYFAAQAFRCIDLTLQQAGFHTQPLHNQVVTMGEWGWVLGVKTDEPLPLKERLRQLTFSRVTTQWINQEAMLLMTSFGKEFFLRSDTVEINKMGNPVLYQYYLKGSWDLY